MKTNSIKEGLTEQEHKTVEKLIKKVESGQLSVSPNDLLMQLYSAIHEQRHGEV